MQNEMEFIPNRCLNLTGTVSDEACLGALASFIAADPVGEWGVYGDPVFVRALLGQKELSGKVPRVVERIEGENALPPKLFICSVRYASLVRYIDEVSAAAPGTALFTVHLLEQIAPKLVPAEAYQPRVQSIYPMRIPEIRVEQGVDFLLLDLPASYSMLRVGLGYVHEIVKRQGIRHQTLDLNMIIYHRFHMHRIMDRPGSIAGPTGYLLPEDPWGPFEIDLWEEAGLLEYFRPEMDALIAEIWREKPRMIGISLQLGNRFFARQLIEGIRVAAPETLIIVGGFDCVHLESGPKLCNDFDYMVIGEAEGSLPLLIERIMAGERPANLPGIVSRRDDPGIPFQPAPVENDLDRLPFPRYDWTELQFYRCWHGGFTAEIAINRGCKWSRCTFCNECFPWRKRSAENVADELQWFAEKGCSFFNFSVSDAIGDSVTLLEIAGEIIRRGLQININTQLRIDRRSDLEFFQTLYRAGFKSLAFGVDGWSNRMLRLQNKGYNMALVEKNLHDAKESGISVNVNIVLGIPGEGDEDIAESLENIIRLKEYISSFNSIYPLLLAPGSKYYADPDAYKIRFRGEQAEILERYPDRVPAELWYSEEPYIDQGVRIARLVHLCNALIGKGVPIASHVVYMVNKFLKDFQEKNQVAKAEAESIQGGAIEMTENTTKPQYLLSILCQGRNDSYMGNFTWRLSTVLNKLAENVAMLGLEERVEILVSDWGSEQPLHSVLELTEPARRLVKYLMVPPEVAASYDRDAGFSVPHAINAIARRARGKYVMFSDSDVYLPMETMAKLVHYLELGYFHSFDLRNSFFWASKFHIPNDFIADSPYREQVEEHVVRHGTGYVHEKINVEEFMGCGVCLLMSREMWFESTGWDERLIYMGWNDIDFTRRLLFKYRFDDLENHGMTFYHLEHYRDRFNPNYARENQKKLNPYVEPTVIGPNPANWGLADHELRFVDGFGLPVEPVTGSSRSNELCRFDTRDKLKSVRQLEAENPLYRGIADRLPFEPHSWFTNAEAINILLQVLQPETVCEIGSWMGASARCFAAAPSVRTVACIDHWDRYRVEKYQPGLHPEHLMNNMYEQFLANSIHTGLDEKICPVRLDSDGAAHYCRDKGLSFDLIYVDGDHTSVGAKADILRYFPFLNEGGYMCGDDWTWQKEPDNVAGAVVAAAQENDWQVYHHGNFWLVIPGGFSVQPLTIEVLQAIRPIRRTRAPQQVPQPSRPAPQKPRTPSELDNIIAPEIRGDELYNLIIELSSKEPIATVLEIGSSAGGGSTEAFVTGLSANPAAPRLYCMEVSRPRFEELRQRYADRVFVRCYNTSSVPHSAFATPAEVERFYSETRTNLNHYPVDQILGWLQQDIDYVTDAGFDQDGIRIIQQENGIDHFDMVLIDGSEFTGESELDRVYGARWILLDDVNAYKNYANYQRLRKDPNYELYRESWQLRNGYAAFKKKEDELPVHFFTIVLNGMPFIHYHANVLKKLPFTWHWHIVEGVADLVHDTSWSLQLGGSVPEACHKDGLSVDGTTEYLDELERLYPGQVTVYRKPKGRFWEGKLEMVQAPMVNLPAECLLWQVDVDEFWSAEQIVASRAMFLATPQKTAAFYWCHFFVGPRLMVSSRNCYSQNPDMEWLRTWRYTRGCQWIAHEPPRLHRPLPDGKSIDLANVAPFLHAETEQQGLVFQHFAYVLPEQLIFKESYYGYKGALACWQRLQKQKAFPVYLRDYFPWVGDNTTVAPVESSNVVPIELPGTGAPERKEFPVTVVDGVFFQMNNTGIARVWKAILSEWAGTDFARSLVVLDRVGTAPRIPGIHYRNIPVYQPGDWDRNMLQKICDDEGADVFVSSYYSTPVSTPSVFLAHDMIPEFTNFYDLSDAQWQEKHHAISRASAFVAVSRNTALDLAKLYPNLSGRIVVAHNGIDRDFFSPASDEEVQAFRKHRGLETPYFMFVGCRNGYKNGRLLLEAYNCLPDRKEFAILFVGGMPELEPSLKALAGDGNVHLMGLSDHELRVAYTGAAALVYPSMYEGFGLPILEAMGCHCPVIACQNSSIPEVAGAAALYVSPADPQQLAEAMLQIVTPEVRRQLSRMGLRQMEKFSWKKMAGIIQEVICNQFLAGRQEIRELPLQAAQR